MKHSLAVAMLLMLPHCKSAAIDPPAPRSAVAGATATPPADGSPLPAAMPAKAAPPPVSSSQGPIPTAGDPPHGVMSPPVGPNATAALGSWLGPLLSGAETLVSSGLGAGGHGYAPSGAGGSGASGVQSGQNGQSGSQTPVAAASSTGGYPTCTNGSSTGGGYGWDPSVVGPNGSHSCLAAATGAPAGPAASPPQTPSSGNLPGLNTGAAGDAQFQITDYGPTLQSNKRRLATAADGAGANAQEKALIIAMAMQETTLMDISQRDSSKDGTPSANCSILNMNYDMLQKLGYGAGDHCTSLNNPDNLPQALSYLLKAFRSWGVQSTLNYQRGGSTAFQDGSSYGAADYRNAITTIYNKIASDMSLEGDSRRVEVNVGGV